MDPLLVFFAILVGTLSASVVAIGLVTGAIDWRRIGEAVSEGVERLRIAWRRVRGRG